MTNIYEKYMAECIDLAKRGEGRVSPNPLVGSIVLDKNGNIVGRGFHKKYGEAHAEVNALKEAQEKAFEGTIFVNLEPCSHYGKTPPCVDAIIQAGIKTVVVGMVDPNPLVSGRGIKKLQEFRINVIEGVLEDECKKLNEIFIKNITRKEPFFSIKTASTIDGKIATKIKSSKWITSELAREKVHQLRNKYDAILTGSGTIIADNPSLDCRITDGINPARIIIDSGLKINPSSKVFNNDETRVLVACSNQIDSNIMKKFPSFVDFIQCDTLSNGKIDIRQLSKGLFSKGIFSVMVEAGGVLNGTLIKNCLIDKFYFFIAPKILGDQDSFSMVESFNILDINKCTRLKFSNVENFPPDILIEAYPLLD